MAGERRSTLRERPLGNRIQRCSQTATLTRTTSLLVCVCCSRCLCLLGLHMLAAARLVVLQSKIWLQRDERESRACWELFGIKISRHEKVIGYSTKLSYHLPYPGPHETSVSSRIDSHLHAFPLYNICFEPSARGSIDGSLIKNLNVPCSSSCPNSTPLPHIHLAASA